MQKDTEQEQETATPFDDVTTQAAISRHLETMGRELEALRLGLDNLKGRGLYVYKLELRAPNTKSTEWLLLVKALDDEGAKISFTSGGSMFATLGNFSRRIRGGAVDWHEDSYPPDDWVERLAYSHKNATWLVF